ncbi:hypothetical protein [Lacicoccus qingdaonensis]|uniref:Uncharacterized protein n=1 Tax=Lacicoccus qingdaonensis TaxID=576118 RepID=A0A1G9HIS6_9BACL|nr:hypothetical protein [Salinicoccus qingdaonensis]SDL12779.1 hypothetical protein SAMN05216216_1241 [Salinicoccus qingdaonensis]
MKLDITIEYKQLFSELLSDLDEFEIKMEEPIYIVRLVVLSQIDVFITSVEATTESQI